jgi:photosystem II stability/assembly factor-like uncharacterized protein
MKKSSFSLISISLSLLLTNYSFAQSSGWFEQQSGTNEILTACSFIDEHLGVAVGFNGKILRTADGGENWISVESNTSEFLYDVQMVSYVVGWAVGNYGTIRKTTDSGLHWFSQVSPSQESFLSCFFNNELEGWLIGVNGVILKTTNGGTDWDIVNIGINNHLHDIIFTSNDTGWIAGSSILLQTVNRGQTWNNIYQAAFDKIFFINNIIGWGIVQGPIFDTSILKTTNSGFDWVSQLYAGSTKYRAIFFVNDEKGWTVGENGTILMTIDGGDNWEDQSLNYIDE